MDIIYVAGPTALTFLFGYLAMNTDGEKHPVLRLMFLFSALAGLLILLNVAQIVSLYGDVVVDTQTTNYTYNGTTLVSSTTAANYTHTSPLVSTNYDMIWLIISTVVWLLFIHTILSLFAKLFAMINTLFFHKGDMDGEIG